MVPANVGSVEELPPGYMAQVTVDGRGYTICNVDGVLYAVDGDCPHRGAPLAFGALHEHTLVCPWHAWEFDCRTGRGILGDLKTFPVAVREGRIYLDAGTA